MPPPNPQLPLSGPIQKIASGLLGFFQLKSPSGLNPTWLRNDLTPTVDLLKWYFQASSQADLAGEHEITLATGNQGFQDFGVAGPILVPQNEFWYVHNFAIITSPLAAADIVHFAGAIRQNPVPTQRQWLTGPPQRVVASGAGDRAIWSARDFWVNPNDSLGLYVIENVVAAARTYAGYIRYTRCPI